VNPAATAPPLLFGVDAVAVARARELWTTFGDALARRVATDAETGWAGTSPERYATLLAVKESAIKCLAGRPPGFRWQCVQLDVGAGPGELPEAVAETLSAFAGGLRLADECDVPCRLSGAGLDRARQVLRAGAGAPIRGAARHGVLDGHVLAAACFWED
jgi:phosphopantetheinyl transferase (holo-ACP synthase)